MKENLHQMGKIMDTLPDFPFLFLVYVLRH